MSAIYDQEIDGPLAFAESTDTTDPRKLQTGTSLTAKGSVPVDAGSLAEVGSSTPRPIRDVVPALNNRNQAINTYQEMSRNDSAVDVSLRAGKTPVLGATWFVQPAGNTEYDIEIAEFVQYNLLEGQSAPFLNVLEDIMRMYEYGFSVMEAVYEPREWVGNRKGANRRKYTMLKKLSPRPASTIKEILYDDNGGPTGITQNALNAAGQSSEVSIDISKLIIFTLNRDGGNLEGRSLLRTSYKHWYYKDHLYKIDAIQKERHGAGVPFIELPPGYTEGDKTAAHELVSNVRTNESAGFVIPPGYKMGFAKPEGSLVDVLRSIEHHNGMIMMNVMVQFLLMGIQESGGGGRATSGSQQNMYEKSLKYVANLIAQYINLYLVPKLVGYNFDTDRFPKLKVRNIGEGKDIQMWASAISNLLSQGVITADIEFENWAREQIDAPMKLEPRPESVKPGNPSIGQDDGEDEPVQTGKGGTASQSTNSGQGNTGKGASEA